MPPTTRAAGAAGGRKPCLPAYSLTRACSGPQDPWPRRRALPHLPVPSRAGGLAMMTEQRAAQRLLSSNAAAVLLRGDPAVRTLAMDLAAATIMAEGTVLWIEAANQFDLYAFAEAAKRWGDPPEALLKRLRIARAFTIYQLGALATDGLERALRQCPDAVTVVSEPLALAWDAEVPGAEARRVLRTLAAGLQRVRQQGHRLLLPRPHAPPALHRHAPLLVGVARPRPPLVRIPGRGGRDALHHDRLGATPLGAPGCGWRG